MRGKAIIVLFAAAGLALGGCQGWNETSETPTPDKKMQTRAEVNGMANGVLARLDSVRPGTRRSVENAAGYAVFTNYGLQVGVLGGGVGRGVAVNPRTGGRTYMRMVEAQAGIGLSARKLQLVWVFDTESKLNDFVNKGWTLGAQGAAAAALEKEGAGFEGAVPVASGVWLYQLTETGLALELTAQGSKYYKDNDIN
jgi:lipid-binding SYLF domain-containing protein